MSRISHTEGGLPARGGDHGPCARSSGRGPRTKCIVGVSHPMVCGQVTGESRGHLAIDWMVREEQAEDHPGAKKKKRTTGHKHHSKKIMKEEMGWWGTV